MVALPVQLFHIFMILAAAGRLPAVCTRSDELLGNEKLRIKKQTVDKSPGKLRGRPAVDHLT